MTQHTPTQTIPIPIIMDIQIGHRAIDIIFSDKSTIEAEFQFRFATGDEGSIANQFLENLTLVDALNPMQDIVRALLSELNETEDDAIEDDEIELDLESLDSIDE